MKQRNSLKLLLMCLIASILLHVFVVFRHKTKQIQPPQSSQQEKSNNRDGDNDYDDGKTSIWVSPGIVPCDSYDGIGVQFNAITGIVSHVAPDSPAYKAGVKNGDELVTPLWNMELIFAQKINLVIIRDGKHITLSVVVDRICHQ